MKKYLLILLAFLSFIPSVTYLLQTWKSSRLDSWDWIFYLLTIPALIWAMRGNPCQKSDWRALFFAIPALGLALTEKIHNINALSVIGSVGFVWSVAFWAGGWSFAYQLLPCFVLLALGTPSSSYRLAQMLALSASLATIIKLLLAVGCFGWIYANKLLKKTVKCETVLFVGTALLSSMILLHADELYYTGRSFIPVFPPHAGNFYGRVIEPDENTKRFFASSSVNQYRYLADEFEISVLAVKCGNNVHEIHPASHCLRTSNWVVAEEKIFSLHPDFAVTEIVAAKGNSQALIWVWYSSDEFSTPGFLGFRRRFRSDGNYHTFQISVPINDILDNERRILKEFISVLPQENVK